MTDTTTEPVVLVDEHGNVLGHTEPRYETRPLRELTEETSLGFDACRFADDVLGVKLRPWQRRFLVHAFELDENGTLRFRHVILLVGRQNGKTLVMIVAALYRLYLDDAKVVLGTAQNLGTAEETWDEALSMIKRVPRLARELKGKPLQSTGKKRFRLKSGHTYLVRAANKDAGRSLTCDFAMIDEAREQENDQAWDAIEPTTAARENGQTWLVSNAGHARSVLLKRLRKQAIDAIDDPETMIGIFEWSLPEDLDPHDERNWGWANPSLGYGRTIRALRASHKSSTDAGWRTEYMCQWVTSVTSGPWDEGVWGALQDRESRIAEDSPLWLVVDTGIDRRTTYIAAVGYSTLPDVGGKRRVHVEIIAKRPGNAWAPGWIDKRWDALGAAGIVVQGRGAPATDLIEPLEELGLPVTPAVGSHVTGSAIKFYDAVRDGEVVHGGQPPLDMAATTAQIRYAGDGIFMWDRRRSPVDCAPLVAVSLGWYFLTQTIENERSVYDRRETGMVVI